MVLQDILKLDDPQTEMMVMRSKVRHETVKDRHQTVINDLKQVTVLYLTRP